MTNVLWSATLDGRYDCKVIRTDEGVGLFTVLDGAKVLMMVPVAMYDALFGPDSADVNEWQDMAEAAVARKDSR